MKNVIQFVILFASCITAFELKAQSNVGLAIGYTGTHWSMPYSGPYQELGDWTSTSGWSLSIPLTYSISKKLALQTELAWIQKGAEVIGTDYTYGYPIHTNVAITINYIEIPMMLRVSIPMQKLDLQFLAGGYASIGLSASLKATATAGSQTKSSTQDLDFEENMMNRFDGGLLFGTGIQFSNKFFIQARYILGLTNVDNSGDPNSVIYNRGIVLSMGQFF